jgi:hypothetical protein
MSGLDGLIDLSKLQDTLESELIYFRATYKKFEEERLLILNSFPVLSCIYAILLTWITLLEVKMKYTKYKAVN